MLLQAPACPADSTRVMNNRPWREARAAAPPEDNAVVDHSVGTYCTPYQSKHKHTMEYGQHVWRCALIMIASDLFADKTLRQC